MVKKDFPTTIKPFAAKKKSHCEKAEKIDSNSKRSTNTGNYGGFGPRKKSIGRESSAFTTSNQGSNLMSRKFSQEEIFKKSLIGNNDNKVIKSSIDTNNNMASIITEKTTIKKIDVGHGGGTFGNGMCSNGSNMLSLNNFATPNGENVSKKLASSDHNSGDHNFNKDIFLEKFQTCTGLLSNSKQSLKIKNFKQALNKENPKNKPLVIFF